MRRKRKSLLNVLVGVESDLKTMLVTSNGGSSIIKPNIVCKR